MRGRHSTVQLSACLPACMHSLFPFSFHSFSTAFFCPPCFICYNSWFHLFFSASFRLFQCRSFFLFSFGLSALFHMAVSGCVPDSHSLPLSIRLLFPSSLAFILSVLFTNSVHIRFFSALRVRFPPSYFPCGAVSTGHPRSAPCSV